MSFSNHGGADWRPALRQRAIAAHDVLLRHPWSSILLASRMNVEPARMRHMDAMLRDLREAGFAPRLLDVAFRTLQDHVVGHALQASSSPFDAGDLPALSLRYPADVPSGECPDLAAHIRHPMDQPTGGVSSSEFGSDSILDGPERAKGVV